MSVASNVARRPRSSYWPSAVNRASEEAWENDREPINHMGTSVGYGWRESSRPELDGGVL